MSWPDYPNSNVEDTMIVVGLSMIREARPIHAPRPHISLCDVLRLYLWLRVDKTQIFQPPVLFRETPQINLFLHMAMVE